MIEQGPRENGLAGDCPCESEMRWEEVLSWSLSDRNGERLEDLPVVIDVAEYPFPASWTVARVVEWLDQSQSCSFRLHVLGQVGPAVTFDQSLAILASAGRIRGSIADC